MCDMTCPSPAALTQHFRYRHLDERPYKCPSCDYGAVYKWDLDKHITRMHSIEQATYFCEEYDCEFTCSNANLMRKHVRNVHTDGPNVYCCHCCNKRYKNGASLSRHLKKEHGFQLPSGHRRFTYHIDIDGVYRVQTTRMESLEVSEQIIAPAAHEHTKKNNITYTLSEFDRTKNGLSISVIETKPTSSSIGNHPKPEIPLESTESGEKATSSQQIQQNEIQSIDSNTFMECLNLKQLPIGNKNVEVVEVIYSNDMSTENQSDDFKNIDNFSVIQKYAKKKRQKNVVTTYTIEEVEFEPFTGKTEYSMIE